MLPLCLTKQKAAQRAKPRSHRDAGDGVHIPIIRRRRSFCAADSGTRRRTNSCADQRVLAFLSLPLETIDLRDRVLRKRLTFALSGNGEFIVSRAQEITAHVFPGLKLDGNLCISR